jgi:hypothetical protein
MSVIKHLTLGTGWGSYTLAPEGRGGGGSYRETQKPSESENRVYEALLKRLEQESACVANAAPSETTPANAAPESQG